MNDPVCIICDNEREGELRTIYKAALNTLIESSKRRRDNRKHESWAKLDSATVHKSCSKWYNSEAAINIAAAAFAQKGIEGRMIKKKGINFDFDKYCFFCGDLCEPGKQTIKLVKSDETRVKIISSIKERQQSEKNNDTYKKILARLEHVKDLTKVHGRYHSKCMSEFYVNRPSSQKGRPTSENTLDFIQHTINFIQNHDSECQFSLNEIQEKFEGYNIPDLKTIRFQLKKYYDDDIDFVNIKTDLVIIFKSKVSSSTWRDWYTNQNKDQKIEKQRIIEMAAKLILEDIRSKVYDRDNYIIPNFNDQTLFEEIPESLLQFLNILVKSHKNKKKENEDKWNKRVATIGHVIIMSARPLSFLSPILIGLSAMLHKKYASKDLLKALSYLGFAVTYDETLRFEASVLQDPQIHTFKPECFIQYVYDNADHNTATIDGSNTFHAMGGIKIVTPESSVETKKTIPRLKVIPSAEFIGKFGFIPVKKFDKKKSEGLKSVKIVDIFKDDSSKPKISMEDLLWLFSKYSNGKAKGYGGFMEEFYMDDKYVKSKIFPLPFVNNPPSDLDTILTVLIEAAAQNKRKNKKDIIFITFDQPLYLKARFILSCVDPNNDIYGLSYLRVRLGGFHTLMSFNGSIGFVMDGSGLKEAFCTIFAENSAEKALDGRAYSRGMRGHSLVQIALTNIIFENMQLSEIESAKLDAMIKNVGTPGFQKKNVDTNEMKSIGEKFIKEIENIKKRGPTAELWLQYWDMLCIVRNFLKAERSGNWELHLKSIKQMIPYFHASGHFHYAKCAHLYVQDMENLPKDMNRHDYDRFTEESFFTVRRSDKFWCGTWTDMIIEQFLMRGMKTQGGLTHGRGMGESVITKFVLTMILLLEVCNVMEDFCNVSYSSSEQHVDSTDSRVTRDAKDLQKLIDFFQKYYPFPETPKLTSIYSGVVGSDNINCNKAFEVGMNSVKSIIEQNFESVKFSRKNRVMSLKSVNSSININDETVTINPLLLFQRLCVNINSKSDMENYLKFELAPIPLALFTENGLRKNTKSQMFDLFTATEDFTNLEDVTHVVDGGYLLHKVVWQKNTTLEQVIEKYLDFIRNHYNNNACIVFDGYADETTTDNQVTTSSSTKTIERLRRKSSLSIPAFQLELHTQITVSKDKFLANENNKIELIKQLSKAFRFHGYQVEQAAEDADVLIVNTAIEIAEKNKNINTVTGETEFKKTVMIIGQDVDLLVLLHQLNTQLAPIYFVKVGSGNVNDRIYSSNCFKEEKYRPYIALLHCLSGCDTISSYAGKGKKTIIESLLKNQNISELMKPFYEADTDSRTIANNGCELIKSIYNASESTSSLDALRYEKYQILTAKCTFSLEKLPPTIGAAKQHSFRVYHQLQKWLGNELDAYQWGWKEVKVNNSKIPLPKFTDCPLIPPDILKKVSCKCTTNCTSNRCGCRKLGLKCTVLCRNCDGSDHCTNTEVVTDDMSDSEEREEPALSLSNEKQQEKLISEDEESSKIVENEQDIEQINQSDSDNEVTAAKRPRLE